MSGYSAFAPYGLLSFGASPSAAEVIYDQLLANQGTAYSPEIGGPAEGAIYAKAIVLGCAKSQIERAGVQTSPLDLAEEILPIRERETGIVPSPYATLETRRKDVAAKLAVSKGARRSNVVAQLQMVLGDAFVALRPVRKDEIVASPATPDDTSGNWLNTTKVSARKLFRLVDPVTKTGDHQDIGYETIDGANASDLLAVGDRVVIDPGDEGRVEVITVTSSVTTASPPTFAGVFQKPHSPGALVAAMRFPRQQSNKRHSLVVVTEKAALDPEIRRRIHGVMRGVSRGVSTWSIVHEVSSGSGTCGPFKVGVGKLGITTIGEMPL